MRCRRNEIHLSGAHLSTSAKPTRASSAEAPLQPKSWSPHQPPHASATTTLSTRTPPHRARTKLYLAPRAPERSNTTQKRPQRNNSAVAYHHDHPNAYPCEITRLQPGDPQLDARQLLFQRRTSNTTEQASALSDTTIRPLTSTIDARTANWIQDPGDSTTHRKTLLCAQPQRAARARAPLEVHLSQQPNESALLTIRIMDARTTQRAAGRQTASRRNTPPPHNTELPAEPPSSNLCQQRQSNKRQNNKARSDRHLLPTSQKAERSAHH